MKMNIRKYAKVLLAGTLSLVLIAQAFNGMSFISKAQGDKVIIPTAETVTVGDASTNGVTDSSVTFKTTSEYNTSGGVLDLFSGHSDITSILNVLGNSNGTAFVLKFTEPIDVSNHNVMTVNAFVGGWSDNTHTIKVNVFKSGATDLATEKAVGSFETVGNLNKEVEFTLDLTDCADTNGIVNNLTFRIDTKSTTTSWVAFGAFRLSYDVTKVPYTELAFGDWGTSVGAFEGSNIYSLKDHDEITSLDHVAISGKVNFNGSSWLRIGGTEEVKHGGLWFGSHSAGLYMTPQGIGGSGDYFPVDAAEWETLKNTEVTLRVTFDKATDESAWTVGVSINGTEKGSYTIAGLNPGLYIGIDSAVTVDMTPSASDTPDEPEEPTYTELAFGDWSNSVGAMEGSNIYSLEGHDDITSLDGVAISGKVNFNGGAWLRIGGTESVKHGGVWLGSHSAGLYMTPQGIGGSGDYFPVDAAEWETLKNTEITLRITFDKATDGSAWTVGVFINGTERGSYTIMGLNPGMYIGIDTAITVDMTQTTPDVPEEPDAPDTPEESTYTELTFSDWSTSVGVMEGSNIYSLEGHDEITSLDGVAISGKVNFNGSNWLRIGGTEEVKHGGLWLGSHSIGLYMTPQGIGGSGDYFPMMAVEWDELKNTEITLRLTFDKAEDGSSWTVGVFVNEVDKGSYIIEGLNPGLYIGVDPAITVDMTTSTPDTPDTPDNPDNPDTPEQPDDSRTYTELTFSDWGIMDGEYITAYAYELTNGSTSLDGTAFNGIINFAGEKTWIRIGAPDGWAGLLISGRENSLIIDSEVSGFSSLDYTVPYTEKNLLTEAFELRLTFDYDSDNNVKLGIWIDDEFQRYLTYKGMATVMGTKLLIDTAGVTIADVGAKDEETDTTPTEKETLPKNLTEVTFESFGIEDGTYKYNGNLLAAEGQYARPLGSSIFSGEFYIPSGSNVDFRYGGVSANWFGLIFANTADGKLYLEGIADDVKVTNSYVFNPTKAGTEFIDTWFNLKLTTEIVDSDSDGAKNDVKLGVWFNDVLYNNKYIELQDYAQYLGNRVGVYVRDADSSVKLKSDTTVYMGVDFTLFGFTRNWEKELGLK